MLNHTINLRILFLHDIVCCLCEFKIIVFFQRMALVSHKHISGSDRSASSRTQAPHMQQNKAHCQRPSVQDLSFCFIGCDDNIGGSDWKRKQNGKKSLFISTLSEKQVKHSREVSITQKKSGKFYSITFAFLSFFALALIKSVMTFLVKK